MINSRESIYAALMSHLRSNAGLREVVKTFTRRLKHWSEVSAEDQPALYLELSGESRTTVTNRPPIITLESNIWLYVKTEDAEVGPILNPILDIIEAAFKTFDGHTETLGGLVHRVWIEGSTQIYEGNLADEAVAVIPLRIMTT